MTIALPAMDGLLALGPSGPFREDSEHRWFTHADGTVRYLGLQAYRDAMVEAGGEPHVADDIVRRMAEHGCQEVLWADAHGGRRGRINASWEVRVAALSTPAATAVPSVTGSLPGVAPPGATDVAWLVGLPEVLNAHRAPTEPERVTTAAPGRLSRLLGMKGRITFGYRQVGHASVAVGHVGATVNVFAGSPAGVEEALARLVAVLVADVRGAA